MSLRARPFGRLLGAVISLGRRVHGHVFGNALRRGVAAMATIFRDDFVVEPEVKHEETMQCARKRMGDVVADSGMVFLLQMLRPEMAGVCWKSLQSRDHATPLSLTKTFAY